MVVVGWVNRKIEYIFMYFFSTNLMNYYMGLSMAELRDLRDYKLHITISWIALDGICIDSGEVEDLKEESFIM